MVSSMFVWANGSSSIVKAGLSSVAAANWKAGNYVSHAWNNIETVPKGIAYIYNIGLFLWQTSKERAEETKSHYICAEFNN